MSSIQYDYSTLSTSMSHAEFGSSLGCSYVDGSYLIAEEDSLSDSNSDSKEHATPPVVPKDRFHAVYLTFGLLGIVILLPFNFFITANDFWMYKLRDVTNQSSIIPVQPSSLQASFTSYLSLASNSPFVIFLLLSSKYSQKIPQLHRVVGSLIVMVMIFIIVTALVDVDTDAWQSVFFEVIMFLVVLMGAFSAVLQAAVTGIVSLFPHTYMHIMVLGQAIAGIVASIAQIASLLGHSNPVKSAFTYFMSANVVLIVTLCSYLFIQKSIFFQTYLGYSGGPTAMKDISGSSVREKISLRIVTKRILPYGLAVMVNLWVSLGIFPGFAVLVQSQYAYDGSIWTDRLFLPLTCFMLYNVSDFCGRIIGGWVQFPPQYGYRLLTVCALRILLIPLFLLCNAHPRHHLPVIFTSDIYYIAFMTFLGLSNGILMVISMISGTKCLTPNLQEAAGLILAAFIGVGLMMGSLSSYLFVSII